MIECESFFLTEVWTDLFEYDKGIFEKAFTKRIGGISIGYRVRVLKTDQGAVCSTYHYSNI